MLPLVASFWCVLWPISLLQFPPHLPIFIFRFVGDDAITATLPFQWWVLPSAADTSLTISQYIDTLLTEIAATPLENDGVNDGATYPLKTVFFGGGTPSLLAVPQVETILNALQERFGIAADAEVSMEMDPATFDLSHAQGYRSVGVNRVSLGVQDFYDEVLAASGRFHRRADIMRAVDCLQQANFKNVSLDLMSGLPHQTLETWQDSLQQAIRTQPHSYFSVRL